MAKLFKTKINSDHFLTCHQASLLETIVGLKRRKVSRGFGTALLSVLQVILHSQLRLDKDIKKQTCGAILPNNISVCNKEEETLDDSTTCRFLPVLETTANHQSELKGDAEGYRFLLKTHRR